MSPVCVCMCVTSNQLVPLLDGHVLQNEVRQFLFFFLFNRFSDVPYFSFDKKK